MLWIEGFSPPPADRNYLGFVEFSSWDLQQCYERLGPKGTVDLVVIGCPQASIGEVRSVVAEVRGRMELGMRIPDNRLWVFTSSSNHDILSSDGSLEILEQAGALLLKDTCPEVTPLQQRTVQPHPDKFNEGRALSQEWPKLHAHQRGQDLGLRRSCIRPQSLRGTEAKNYPRQNQIRSDPMWRNQ